MAKILKLTITLTIVAICIFSLIINTKNVGAATSVFLSQTGHTETTITLSWTESEDVFFSGYTVYMSTDGTNGPFNQVWSTTAKEETTFYVYDLEPETSYWFYVADSGSLVGTSNSNTLQAATNPNPTIVITSKTTTTASLQWVVYNSYSSLIPFQNYEIQMSTDDGPWATLTTVSDVDQNTYMVTGLSPALYNFRLVDNAGNFSSTSNTANLIIHKPVEVQLNQPPVSSINLGEQIELSALVNGGTGSYSYQWYSNDSFIQGETSTILFNPSQTGNYNITCIVTDNQDTLLSPATSNILLTVNEPTKPTEQETQTNPTQNPNSQNQENDDTDVNNSNNEGLPLSYVIIILAVIAVIGIVAVMSIRQKSAEKSST